MSELYTGAVILAAGYAIRMGHDKIMLNINQRPVIEYSMKAFQKAETVDEIVIATLDDFIDDIEKIAEKYNLFKVKKVIKGGNTRIESAYAGLNVLSDKCKYICVHDGARPLIRPDDIDNVNNSAYQTGAACCGTVITDTVKSVNKDGFVKKTLDRNELRSIATPQTFDINLYRKAFEAIDGDWYTDDASFVEHYGARVKFVECSADNFKLTVPSDIEKIKKYME